MKKINNRMVGEVKSKPSKLYWSGVDTKDNWIKAKWEGKKVVVIPARYVIETRHSVSEYGQDVIIDPSFISQVEKDAIEKTNKRWREKCEKLNKKPLFTERNKVGDWERSKLVRECYNQALSDLLEDKEGV